MPNRTATMKWVAVGALVICVATLLLMGWYAESPIPGRPSGDRITAKKGQSDPTSQRGEEDVIVLGEGGRPLVPSQADAGSAEASSGSLAAQSGFGVFRWTTPAQDGAAPAGGAPHVPGEVLVKFREGADPAAIADVHRRHGTEEIYRSARGGFSRVRIHPQGDVMQMVAMLSREPAVEYAEPNSICRAFLTPNDPYYVYQWHLDDAFAPNPFGGPNGGGINVGPAWDLTSGDGVVVAVLDTGIAYETARRGGKNYYLAPDLANTTFLPGYDFAYNDPYPNDDNSHGTHVAGTIAQSTNNGVGTAGVAFGAALMPVKVLDKNGYGTAATVADGLYFAADNGAKVANLSLGWPVSNGVAYDPGQTVRNAVAYAYNKGVTIVCAAGNDGQGAVAYPAAYDDYCIAVGATRYDETRASYSNYGASLDLCAPGGDLGVDQNGDGYGDGVLQNTFNPTTKNTRDFGYWFFDGTSMATPHVSGVAALVIAKGASSPDEVRQILESTAEDKGAAGWDAEYGHGIVDAAAALALPANRPPVADDQSVQTDEDTPVAVVLTATDPDGDPLTFQVVAPPQRGTLSGTPPDLTYTPSANYYGDDAFSFRAQDAKGALSNVATVSITVAPVQDPPTARDDAATTERGAWVDVAVLANDDDPDGDTLVVTAVSDPANGTAQINADGLTVRYTPDGGFIGTDTFDYTVSDGQGNTATATVTIQVVEPSPAPVAFLRIDMSASIKRNGWTATATVTARLDSATGPRLGGATVRGRWSGAYEGAVSGVTNSKGVVKFTTPLIADAGTAVFAVEGVSLGGEDYELAGETEDAISGAARAR